MFTDEEVKAIRDLASRYSRTTARTQLQALVQMARRGTLEELCLEIDRRRKKNKIRQDFANTLTSSLRRLKDAGSDIGNREKRALFIKNVADLGDFKAQ